MAARIESIVRWARRKLWPMWQRALGLLKSHPARTAAIVLLVLGLLIWRLSYSSELAVELVGIAITVLVIDSLNEYRAERREKRALILQMGSPDRGFAVEAARVLRVRGWLTDGSLRGADLRGANLQRASLGGANLQGASLGGANLQGTDLREAHHLDSAKLDGAKVDFKTQWPEGFQVPDTVEMLEY